MDRQRKPKSISATQAGSTSAGYLTHFALLRVRRSSSETSSNGIDAARWPRARVGLDTRSDRDAAARLLLERDPDAVSGEGQRRRDLVPDPDR